MSHESTPVLTVGGVSARAIIEDNVPSEGYVKVTLEVTPPNPGIDRYPYSIHVKKPSAT